MHTTDRTALRAIFRNNNQVCPEPKTHGDDLNTLMNDDMIQHESYRLLKLTLASAIEHIEHAAATETDYAKLKRAIQNALEPFFATKLMMDHFVRRDYCALDTTGWTGEQLYFFTWQDILPRLSCDTKILLLDKGLETL